MFAALFLLASSRMPTRTSPHRPISAPQSVQVTTLSFVEWAGGGESIAATLAAPEGGSVRVRLDRLRHDTASILVGRPTGEEWLNGASLFLKRPLSSNFAFLLAKLHTGVFCMTRKRKVDPALERQFWIAFAAVTGLGVLIVLLDAYLRRL